MTPYPLRIIEVDLPIARISAHARREKSIRHGHISTLHIWWARRPLAACRAVILASLWPDPVDLTAWLKDADAKGDVRAPRGQALKPTEGVTIRPARFLDEARTRMNRWATLGLSKTSPESYSRLIKIQKNPKLLDDPAELRAALLDFIADFANWDHSTDKDYLETSRALVQAAHEALGGEPGTRPLVIDPFAGGGSIPLEALRVGADAFASDLNPIPVLLNKVVLEYIPTHGQKLADEVRKWGQWIKEQAEKELAEFYPKDPDGSTPIAYLWARTVLSEAPAELPDEAPIEVPLLRSLWLAKKAKRKRALRWVRDPSGRVKTNTVEVTYGNGITRLVRRPELEIFEPKKDDEVEAGTASRGAAICPVTGFTTSAGSVKLQLATTGGGRHAARMFAVYAEQSGGRDFRACTISDASSFEAARRALSAARSEDPDCIPTEPINSIRPHANTRGMSAVTRIGCSQFGDLYNDRQAFCIHSLFRFLGSIAPSEPKISGAIQTLLALAVSRSVYQNTTMSRWDSSRSTIKGAFSKQALAVVWDFAEANPLSGATADWDGAVEWVCRFVESNLCLDRSGTVTRASAFDQVMPTDAVDALVTDPPYFAAIPYADLSDFFYVWFRRHLKRVHSGLFATTVTEKSNELIVTNGQLGPNGEVKDARFFQEGMTAALTSRRHEIKSGGIGVVVYAEGTTAGWEAVLSAIMNADWKVTGSWPIDTEMENRTRAQGSASLQSSVHLICRPRDLSESSGLESGTGEWRNVLSELPLKIREWMPRLDAEGVVGADAIFACLGPALEVYSRYARVERASGEAVLLPEYLEHVWATVSAEALSLIFKDADAGDLEPDARLTAMWLWTLGAGKPSTAESADDADEATDSDDEDEAKGKKPKAGGFALEFDAARKIAQGLGVHLEKCQSFVEVKGETARLLPVEERTRYLFGKDTQQEVATPRGRGKKKAKQASLFEELDALESETAVARSGAGGGSALGAVESPRPGATVLDKVHQSMLLFATGRSEAMKRFLVDDGVGKDARFWKLAQSLSALYPTGTNEKRWVDGVLARKKGLGL